MLLVAVSLTAVLIALLPAVQALARAARSVEKLADTLSREFPPTLEAIRLTGLEISELTDDVSEGVQSASEVVKQVDQSLGSAKKQAQKVQVNTRSLFTGLKVAWKTLTRKPGTLGGTRRTLEHSRPRTPLSLRESSLEDPYVGSYSPESNGSRDSSRYRAGEPSHLEPSYPEEFEQLGSNDP